MQADLANRANVGNFAVLDEVSYDEALELWANLYVADVWSIEAFERQADAMRELLAHCGFTAISVPHDMLRPHAKLEPGRGVGR